MKSLNWNLALPAVILKANTLVIQGKMTSYFPFLGKVHIGQIYGEDFAKICGLLRIYEL